MNDLDSRYEAQQLNEWNNTVPQHRRNKVDNANEFMSDKFKDLRQRLYGEGYKQGRYDLTMDALYQHPEQLSKAEINFIKEIKKQRTDI